MLSGSGERGPGVKFGVIQRCNHQHCVVLYVNLSNTIGLYISNSHNLIRGQLQPEHVGAKLMSFFHYANARFDCQSDTPCLTLGMLRRFQIYCNFHGNMQTTM